MRRGGAALGGSRPPCLPHRGGPRLRRALVRSLAGGSARPARADVHPRLGHGRRGRAIARRPRDRRLFDPQRLHGRDRDAGRLRRVGTGLGPFRPGALPAPGPRDAPGPPGQHRGAGAAPRRVPRGGARCRVLRARRPRRSVAAGRRVVASGERRRRDPVEHGVRVPRRGERPAEPRRPPGHAGRPCGPGRGARDRCVHRRRRADRRRHGRARGRRLLHADDPDAERRGARAGAGATRHPDRGNPARRRAAARPSRHGSPMGADRAPLAIDGRARPAHRAAVRAARGW